MRPELNLKPEPPKRRTGLWPTLGFLLSGPVAAFGAKNIAEGARTIRTLADRMRAGPQPDRRVRTGEDRVLDLAAIAFLGGTTGNAQSALSLPALAAALAAVLAWSSAFVGIGLALRTIPPGQLVLLRFLVASACFSALATAGRVRLLAQRDVPSLAALGLVGHAVYQFALSAAQTRISAGRRAC